MFEWLLLIWIAIGDQELINIQLNSDFVELFTNEIELISSGN